MEVLGQAGVVAVHKVNFKGVILIVLSASIQMILRWHHIAHIPINFPLAEHWEPQLIDHLDLAFIPASTGATNVSNIIIIVEAVDVIWEVNGEVSDSVLPLVWVDVGHVVNARELTVDASSQVKEVEVLVDGDLSPVRNENVSLGLREHW